LNYFIYLWIFKLQLPHDHFPVNAVIPKLRNSMPLDNMWTSKSTYNKLRESYGNSKSALLQQLVSPTHNWFKLFIIAQVQMVLKTGRALYCKCGCTLWYVKKTKELGYREGAEIWVLASANITWSHHLTLFLPSNALPFKNCVCPDEETNIEIFQKLWDILRCVLWMNDWL
jgi:hypothetical protein